jgi:hypothetical protein
MDLGAPILDVQAVATGEDTGTTTSIVTNGVVTAPGFDPIIITSTAGNSGTTGGRDVYIPDVDIYHSNTTIYRNISVGGSENSQKMNSTSLIAIIISIIILVLLLLGCIGRYVY